MLCSVPSIPIILCCQEYSSLLPSVPMEISRPSILRIQHSHTVQTESHPVGWGITNPHQMTEPRAISDTPYTGFVDVSCRQKHTSTSVIPPESILAYRTLPSGSWHAVSPICVLLSRKQVDTWFCEMVHPRSLPTWLGFQIPMGAILLPATRCCVSSDVLDSINNG